MKDMNRISSRRFACLLGILSIVLFGLLCYPLFWEASIPKYIKNKFEHGLWDKLRYMIPFGVNRKYSLIIWFVNETVELKECLVSILTEKIQADIYYVCEVFPAVLARVSVQKILEVASYDFVIQIGDGEEIITLETIQYSINNHSSSISSP